MGEAVRWEKKDYVATVWLCRPERRNAMGTAFWAELPEVMGEVSQQSDVRAVVLAAEGRDFTIGLDLKEMAGLIMNPEPGAEGAIALRRKIIEMQGAINAVADCPVPTIAAIHGWCIGGGVDLVTACDMRLASADMKLSVRETKIAIVADMGTLQRLPRIITRGHANELVYTGRDIDAARAAVIGLVNDVYDDADGVQAAAQTLAAEIAANSPITVSGVREVMRFSEEHSVDEGLRYVAAWNAAFLRSKDLSEAVMAFMERRPANFQGPS